MFQFARLVNDIGHFIQRDTFLVEITVTIDCKHTPSVGSLAHDVATLGKRLALENIGCFLKEVGKNVTVAGTAGASLLDEPILPQKRQVNQLRRMFLFPFSDVVGHEMNALGSEPRHGNREHVAAGFLQSADVA